MARTHHLPLFHPRLVRERIKSLDPSLFGKHEKAIGVWLEHLRSGALDETNEVELHGGFLERIFGDVLGYSTWSLAKDGVWELDAEKKVLSGGRADGAIGFFSKVKRQSKVIAPIELKGAAVFLDHAKSNSRTPIQQGWDYANNAPESRWIIVSNYRETRLYAKSRGQAAYELFRLDDLGCEDGFLRFMALLGRDAILGGPSVDHSPLTEMLLSSERTEREITERLYAKYREVRARVFAELLRRHSNLPTDELLGYAQTILDRVLFLAFAEDRSLVPHNTIARAYGHRDPYHPRPIWQNFISIFRSVDEGNQALDIPLYNGGLFRRVPEIEELEVSDETCGAFKELGEYDFAEDVSVEVLGHIFEQSITDLALLRKEAAIATASASTPTIPSTGTQKAPSKRKVEGIFYTPPFITSFLVRETVGQAIGDAWERAGVDRATKKKDRIEAWETYQNQLRRIRILDPACGSGAFLIAAFDVLAQQFDRANRVLAELRGQQTGLFDLTKTVLNENLFGVDKSAESVDITKLSLWLKTAERGKKLTFLDRNIRHGNSVVSDPMVDTWAFDWKAGRVARPFLELAPPNSEDAEAFDARWRDGFDVVIGNPPYVRQELLTAYKQHWQTSFSAFDGKADLFVYFFERGIQQLKTGGRLGFIVSNKWLRSGYAKKLRKLLSKECTIETLVDFGHAPIFPDADAFPCIITVRKLAPRANHTLRVTIYPREALGKELLANYVEEHRIALPQSTLSADSWALEHPGVQALLEKLGRHGVPLCQYSASKPYRGVLTGCNKAFLIDKSTKERLCREDPCSAEILKKYLRGQDVARWAPEWAGLWMIFARRGIDIDRYPAIKAHLEHHRAALEPKPKTYAGENWPGRKPGSYKWYELQDTVDFFEYFESPKLVWKDISFHSEFSLDDGGYYTNDLCFILPDRNLWLLAVMNSPAMWAWLWRNTLHGKDEALRLKNVYVNAAPIPQPSDDQREIVCRSVETIIELTRATYDESAALLDVLRIEYDIDALGQALKEFFMLDSDAFVREVKKRRAKDSKPLSPAALKALRELYDSEVPGILQKRSQILSHERNLATQVHAAYKLTEDDLRLLRETQPPRMPPGW